jgi:predicted permease
VPVADVVGTVVLPIFLIAAAAAVLHQFRPLPVGPLNTVIVYLFSPALVFHTLATTELPVGEIGKILLFSFLLLGALYVVAMGSAVVLRLDGSSRGTFVVSVLFMNAGNYGLPVAMFAFGAAGFSIAIVFFVIQAILGWTVGVFLVAQTRGGISNGIRSVVRLPTSYAAIAGAAAGTVGIELPEALMRSSELLGSAAVPGMLVVLGIHVVTNRAMSDGPAIVGSLILRLIVSAFVASMLAAVLDFDEIAARVLIVSAAMPTAVFTTILAAEFGGRPQMAGSIVVASTVLSLATVTAVLTIVGVP